MKPEHEDNMTCGSTIAMNLLCFMNYHCFHSFITYTEVGVGVAHTHIAEDGVYGTVFLQQGVNPDIIFSCCKKGVCPKTCRWAFSPLVLSNLTSSACLQHQQKYSIQHKAMQHSLPLSIHCIMQTGIWKDLLVIVVWYLGFTT